MREMGEKKGRSKKRGRGGTWVVGGKKGKEKRKRKNMISGW